MVAGHGTRRGLALVGMVVAGLLSSPSLARAQAGTGTVAGVVAADATGQPLLAAQVSIPGSARGTVTDAQGRFTIPGVPAGETEVRVQLIGYGSLQQTVTVPAGATATVEFRLRREVVALDAVVVTGTAGQARVREVGISMGQVNADALNEPPRDVESMLQGQVSGVNINATGGSVGSGAMIRLRGNSSVSMGNQPLIYVDGVRLHSSGYPRNQPAEGFQGRSSDAFQSTMNEVNPADIERIEVIKGPAATTLYGTEAAAGVIQIFTRRGRAGTARWTFQMDQGLAEPRKFGPPNEPLMRMESVLRTGWTQAYGAQVAGGLETAQYFVSVRRDSNEGVFLNDKETKTTVRGNFRFVPLEGLTVDWNTAYADVDLSQTPTGNNSNGVTAIALRAQNSALGAAWRENIHRILEWEILNFHKNLTTGLSATYLPIPNFTNRFTVGLNRLDADMRNIRNYGFILSPAGVLSNQRWSRETLTADYVGGLKFDLTPDLSTTISFGGQYIATEEGEASLYGESLPGPSIPTVSSAAIRTAFERRIRVVTGGFFGQAQFGLRDRYFLTTGLRVDGNSAFGSNFGLQAYPKIDASYVISDEEFWPAALGTLRLRAAYGQAGRAPGAFDSFRTWDPIGFAGMPAFLPGNVGNPDLGPERAEELEFGLDAGLFGDRLSVTFTYYDQTVKEALLNVTQIPSAGFGGSQLQNVGKLANSGIELAISGDVVQAYDFTWNLGVDISTNHSKLLDLGEAVESATLRLGKPWPIVTGTKLLNPYELASPQFQTNYEFGSNQPTHTLRLNTRLEFPWRVVLTARGEYQGGHYVAVSGTSNTTTRSAWPACEPGGNNGYALIRAGRIDELRAIDRVLCTPAPFPSNFPRVKQDYFSLREITLRFPIDRLVPGTNDASFALSARNWYNWLNDDWAWSGFHPDIIGRPDSGLDALVRSIPEQIPPPKTLTTSVRITF